jgi:hypothetical protein
MIIASLLRNFQEIKVVRKLHAYLGRKLNWRQTYLNGSCLLKTKWKIVSYPLMYDDIWA